MSIDEILLAYKNYVKECLTLEPTSVYNPKIDTAQAKQAIKQLINQARIDELEKIMNGQKTLRSFITNDGGEEQIITFEFANAEIQDRLKELKSDDD